MTQQNMGIEFFQQTFKGYKITLRLDGKLFFCTIHQGARLAHTTERQSIAKFPLQVAKSWITAVAGK